MSIFSAGINFGKPNTEIIVESDESGVVQSCRNVVTGIEYVGGGGGDSDFTIANVTITTTDLNYNVPHITEVDGIELIIGGLSSESGDLQVPLYKGNAVLSTDEPLTITVTGSITPIIEGLAYLITGDGTITISD